MITTEHARPKLGPNRAVVITKIDDVSIQDWPLKVDAYPDSPLYEPGTPLPPGKVLLRIRSGGICGSDVRSYTTGCDSLGGEDGASSVLERKLI
jgi:threonine dehydrogenase-like Zn-dependent dehydrogenase